MKQINGWWFGTEDKKLSHNDNRKIIIRKTHKIKGDIIPCQHGLHLSKNIIDALNYSPGPVIYRVVGSGIIIPHGNPIDKYVCSERTYISGGVDISDTLRLFARKCALDVIHLWDPSDIVIRYLKTGDESIRASARDAAWAAMDAVRASERNAARAAAWASERNAVRDAAWAAWDAAMAAGASARDAAWAAMRKKFNKRLTSMVSRIL